MPRPRLLLPLLVSSLASVSAVLAEDAPPAPAPVPVPAAESAAPAPDSTSPVAKKSGDDITADEILTLLRQLKQMRDGLDAEGRRAVAEALRALGPASAGNTDAVKLWQESVRVIDFDKQNKKSSEFEEWRKKNNDKLHDSGFATALRFQCRYMKLCLEADTREKAEAAMPAIIALMEESIKALPDTEQHAGLLREDVFGSYIARRFGVEKRVPEGWPRGVLGIDGHFKRVLKVAVAEKPSSVGPIWETRMKLERAMAEASDRADRIRRHQGNPEGFGKKTKVSAKDPQDGKNVDTFETERLPRLLWSMGEDFFTAGMRRKGVEILFGVLRKYPKHPECSAWVDRITAIAESMAQPTDELNAGKAAPTADKAASSAGAAAPRA